MFANTVPVYDGDSLCGYTDLDSAKSAAAAGRVEGVWNRRKRLQRVRLKQISVPTVRLLPGGNSQSFEEVLPSGHVCWSLRGHGKRVEGVAA